MQPVLIHTSDSQIKNWPYGGINLETGLNRRFEDALACFDFIIDHAIKLSKTRKVYFIHAGDVNEERNPDAVAQNEFAKRIKKLIDNKIVVIIVVGNHDIDSAIGTTTSVSYLKSLGIKGVHIVDRKIEVIEYDGIRFLGIPYFTKSQLGFSSNEEVVEMIKKRCEEFLEQEDADDFFNVAIPHYGVDKVFEGLSVNEPVLPIEIFQGFDYTALGHIHTYIMYFEYGVTGGYCGSPYKVKFGENEDKFFNSVDLESGEIDKIKIPNRDFIDLEIDAMDADQSAIDQFVINKLAKMKIENTFLKISIKCYSNFNPKPIYDYLKSKNLFHFLPIQFNREKVRSEARLTSSASDTFEKIVENFLANQELPKKFKREVLKECQDIILKFQE